MNVPVYLSITKYLFLQYNIQPLYKLCTSILWSKITTNNAVNNFFYADLLNLTSEKLNIARFIVEKKKKIEKTESWKEITEERRDWLEIQLSELPQNEDENEDEEDKDEKDKNEKDKDEEAKNKDDKKEK